MISLLFRSLNPAVYVTNGIFLMFPANHASYVDVPMLMHTISSSCNPQPWAKKLQTSLPFRSVLSIIASSIRVVQSGIGGKSEELTR